MRMGLSWSAVRTGNTSGPAAKRRSTSCASARGAPGAVTASRRTVRTSRSIVIPFDPGPGGGGGASVRRRPRSPPASEPARRGRRKPGENAGAGQPKSAHRPFPSRFQVDARPAAAREACRSLLRTEARQVRAAPAPARRGARLPAEDYSAWELRCPAWRAWFPDVRVGALPCTGIGHGPLGEHRPVENAHGRASRTSPCPRSKTAVFSHQNRTACKRRRSNRPAYRLGGPAGRRAVQATADGAERVTGRRVGPPGPAAPAGRLAETGTRRTPAARRGHPRRRAAGRGRGRPP